MEVANIAYGCFKDNFHTRTCAGVAPVTADPDASGGDPQSKSSDLVLSPYIN